MTIDDFFKAFAAPLATVIAAAVAAIFAATFAVRQARAAEQQAKTARNKLKIDTFQLRYDVYYAALLLIETIIYKSSLDDNDIKIYTDCKAKCLQSRFLFDEAKSDYIEDIVSTAGKYRLVNTLLKNSTPTHPKYEERSKRLEENEQKLQQYAKKLPDVFRKDLNLNFVHEE